MININISTLIYQPVRKVFDFVSAPENDFQWQYGTLASARLSEDMEGGLGTFFRSIGHLLGRRNLSTFEVIVYERNRKYGFKTHAGPLHVETIYIFEMVHDGTKVHISTQVNTINFLWFSEGVLEKKMKKQLKENAAILKDLLEAKQFLSVPDAVSLA